MFKVFSRAKDKKKILKGFYAVLPSLPTCEIVMDTASGYVYVGTSRKVELSREDLPRVWEALCQGLGSKTECLCLLTVDAV